MPKWPRDTMADKIAFYGDPRGPHGQSPKWLTEHTVRIVPPYQMYYAGKPIKSILFHRKCAAALHMALTDIWLACGKDAKRLAQYGLDQFGGANNYRLIRGSSSLSNHAFAIAIDLAPDRNPLGRPPRMPPFAVEAFKKQGFRWGGDYSGRKDGMHFEAVS